MSRSGYDDDGCGDMWDWVRYRGAVKSAMRGQRGQAFLREMLAALYALPEKRLIQNDLVDEYDDGAVCALGAVGRARNLDMAKVDRRTTRMSRRLSMSLTPSLARSCGSTMRPNGARKRRKSDGSASAIGSLTISREPRAVCRMKLCLSCCVLRSHLSKIATARIPRARSSTKSGYAKSDSDAGLRPSGEGHRRRVRLDRGALAARCA